MQVSQLTFFSHSALIFFLTGAKTFSNTGCLFSISTYYYLTCFLIRSYPSMCIRKFGTYCFTPLATWADLDMAATALSNYQRRTRQFLSSKRVMRVENHKMKTMRFHTSNEIINVWKEVAKELSEREWMFYSCVRIIFFKLKTQF